MVVIGTVSVAYTATDTSDQQLRYVFACGKVAGSLKSDRSTNDQRPQPEPIKRVDLPVTVEGLSGCEFDDPKAPKATGARIYMRAVTYNAN